ncbi:hypothetical protein SAY87_017095 [Trapa incisa]|uniref:DUF3511 domain protein n=1 Tax=Trapa incisa TaxID=236973 RepID=A0AAN7LB96_9MYRT|nr:hypothetical protein SAY87_017095 [Trapa incisa]
MDKKFRSVSCKKPEGFGYISCGSPPPPQQPSSMQDLRCYSVNHAHGKHQPQQAEAGPKAAKSSSKGKNDRGAGSMSKSWSFTDPELQRKKRVASYKVYAVEGKMKGSIKKSFRWIKSTCSNVVYGSWW